MNKPMSSKDLNRRRGLLVDSAFKKAIYDVTKMKSSSTTIDRKNIAAFAHNFSEEFTKKKKFFMLKNRGVKNYVAAFCHVSSDGSKNNKKKIINRQSTRIRCFYLLSLFLVVIITPLRLFTSIETTMDDERTFLRVHQTKFQDMNEDQSMGEKRMMSLDNLQINETPIGGYETCIVVGFLSRSIEFDLRDWQRNEFKKQINRFSAILKQRKVLIQQRFMIGINSERSVMSGALLEKQQYGDLMMLRINEGYSYLTANTWDTFHQLLPQLENPSCKSAFLVRADTDFVVNYRKLTETILSMPKTSTYFGTFIPNYPTPEYSTREAGSFAHDLFPLWAVGGLYGFSVDVVKQLISPDVERTVLKKKEKYVFPEEDRAIGLALARSNTTIENLLFTKDTFHFCPPENFTCDDYGHFMGFSVGYGKSGQGQNRLDMKMEYLAKISDKRNICEEVLPPSNVLDSYFKVDKSFIDEEPDRFLTYGCKSLNEEGEHFIDSVRSLMGNVTNQREWHADSTSKCAETIYREVYPEVNDFIKNKTFASGKEHYMKAGYRNTSMHYYCPRVCNDDPTCSTVSKKDFFKCDREERYLRLNPDVRDAVRKGIFESGFQHYRDVGYLEKGRDYYAECSIYDQFKADAVGNKKDCSKAFSKFIKKTKPEVSKWPVTGDDSNRSNTTDTCKAVLFIEGRDHRWMDYALRTHRHFTGPEWIFYLVGPKTVTTKWRQLYDGPMVEIIDLPERFGDLSDYPKQINDLYMSTFLWNEVVQCENVLVSQTDAILLRHGIEDFMKYSYVGAPIYPESHPTVDWRVVYNMGNNRISGGNGGFSFRKRSFMLEQLANCKLKLEDEGGVFVAEDGWFSACLLESGAPLPSITTANRFSTGSTCEVDVPLGVHKLWQNCEQSTCLKAISTSSLYHEIFDKRKEYTPTRHRFCKFGDIAYLAQYPEVRQAVDAGKFKTGYQHWAKYGRHSYFKYKCLYPELKDLQEVDPFQVDERYFDNFTTVKS